LIIKVVIPVAGLGTRLLPMTKELPKEMLPIFVAEKNGRIRLKPMLQAIFEQLYDTGYREFGFIVGRGKRAVEDHFTPDGGFLELLKSKNSDHSIEELSAFYNKINNSLLVFINQPSPKGFGDAVHKAKAFTRNEPFLVHAGDDLVFSDKNQHLTRMLSVFQSYDADAVFLVEEVKDASKYGVIEGVEVDRGIFEVKEVVEKPEVPPSNLAIIAIYVFKPKIYDAIESVVPGKNGEIQLGDALQLLLKRGCKVYALKLGPNECRIDIGTPETYLATFKNVLQRNNGRW
jgi:UTP--glucose-1-phosphate uridylyltransferase